MVGNGSSGGSSGGAPARRDGRNCRHNSLLKNLAKVLDAGGDQVMVFLVKNGSPRSGRWKAKTALGQIGLTNGDSLSVI
jgi:hypothetical protein